VEILAVLKVFAKDKSLGLDRWMVGLFLSFFDLVGDDLLEAVEESRRSGTVNRSLNSIFMHVFIPKVNKPTTFGDFIPITLCKLIYKIISNLIATRNKLILSWSLAGE